MLTVRMRSFLTVFFLLLEGEKSQSAKLSVLNVVENFILSTINHVSLLNKSLFHLVLLLLIGLDYVEPKWGAFVKICY